MITLKEHNLRPYKQLTQILEHSNKCAIVSATGTGKSYIAAKYIEDHNLLEKTLFVVPSSAIQYSWQKLFEQAHVITYTSLLKIEKRPNLSEVELIVCDEYHHLGAKKWGAAFKEFADGFVGKLIGLSATPIRYLDDGRDMTKEIFEDNVVYGYDLAEAIDDSILPSFKYITSIYDLPHRVNEYKKKSEYKKIRDMETTTKLIAKLDVACSKHSVKSIMQENFNEDVLHKVVVFVNQIKEIETIEKMCKNVFPKWNRYTVHSKMKKEHISEEISAFESSTKSAFIFAVDIFNEGIHVNNVDGIIMFRKTISPIVYLQQVGRGLTSNNTDKRITIIDFVANYNNLVTYKGVGKGIYTFNKYIKKNERQIIIKDFAIEQGELLSELSFAIVEKFTEEEENILRENYYPGRNLKEMEVLLPGRTAAAIRLKLKKMNLYNNGINFWTKEDDEILVTNYLLGKSMKELQELLPNHPKGGHEARLMRLGIYQKKAPIWTNEAVTLLIKYRNMGLTTPEICKLIPGISKHHVTIKVKELELTKTIHWTEQEDKILLENFTSWKNIEKLCKLLPNRSKGSIQRRLRHFELYTGSRYWTKEEDETIRTNYKKEEDLDFLCELLPGRSKSAIEIRVKNLGLYSCPKFWTKEERQLIEENAHLSTEELSKLLPHRSKSSIAAKRKSMGIIVKVPNWTIEEESILHTNYLKGCSFEELQKLLPNRTISSIQRRIYILKLSKENRRKDTK